MNSSQRLFPAGGPPRWWAAGGVETTVVLPAILAGACVLGLAGNLLLLLALSCALRRGESSPAQALLLGLCSADLVLVLFCVPARVATYARRSWVFGGLACKAAGWLLQGCLVAKGLTWAAVGQARYRQVAASCQGRGWSWSRSWRHLAGVLCSLWAAALLLPLPHLLFAHVDRSPRTGLSACVFRSPRGAATFMEVFSKLYPLAALLAPAGIAWSCFGRALRLQGERRRQQRLAKPGAQSRRATRLLLGLSALFQAMWLPGWVVWLWERHSPAGGGPQPPPALRALAEVLAPLNCALGPAVLLARAEELRGGLRAAWREARSGCRAAQERPDGAGESPQALADLKAAPAAAEKVLPPDVENFWRDRRSAAAGEESDPVPWEHQEAC